jgi:hypothetical protein
VRSSTERELSLRRREFLVGAGVALGALALPLGRARGQAAYQPPAPVRDALAKSPLVYVSPLRADGAESTCHGEVWFFVDQGDVVLATGKDGWKARALGKGLDRARLWVGDLGPAKGPDGPFRKAPTFMTRARLEPDRAAFDRLLEEYGKKYPAEWDKWQPRFRKGYDEGSRVVIRYTPIGA